MVMFSQVSVCPRGGGVCLWSWGCLLHPLGRHPLAQCMLGYTHPNPVHAGIRSTSGRYASHWNAFLFGVDYSSTFMRCILQIDAHVDTLVSEQAAFVLNRSNLAELYSAVQQHQPKQGPLSSQPGMDSISVKSSMVRTIVD